MGELVVKKNGLLYSSDLKSVLGIDPDSDAFTGAVPNGAEYISDGAFSGCALESISLPESVKRAGSRLFENSTALKSVKLPSGLRILLPYMFSGCSSLEKVVMPVEVDGFPEGLFSGCSSLREIPFRAGIKELPVNVFSGCSSIVSLVIPDSVSVIRTGAVADCARLSTAVLPESLEVLEDGAFRGCPKLSHIRINGENSIFRADEDAGIIYRKNPAGTEISVLSVSERIQNEIPLINSIDENVNFPIMPIEDFDEDMEEDSEMDIILSPEEEKLVAGNQPEESSAADTAAVCAPVTADNAADTEAPAQEQSSEESGGEQSDSEKSIEERLAEIMEQEKAFRNDGLSISDIPYASSEEIAAERIDAASPALSSPAEHSAGQENMSFAENNAASENAAPAYDEMMQALICEKSDRAGRQCADTAGSTGKELFVFTESLAENNGVNRFSKRLVSCCRRLAEIHGFTDLYFFYNVHLEDEEFRAQFKQFMADKNTVFACRAPSISKLSDYARETVSALGISLEKETLAAQRTAAGDRGIKLLKLIIQDNLSE